MQTTETSSTSTKKAQLLVNTSLKLQIVSYVLLSLQVQTKD